jgi:hypothetical protein
MSFEPYHFNMVLRLEGMTRAERRAADERAGRMAYGLWRLARAAGQCAGSLRRQARLDPFGRGATMRPRRNP